MRVDQSPFKKGAAAHPASERFVWLIGATPSYLLEKRQTGIPRENSISHAPTVSAVICAYNEEQNIGSLLSTLVDEGLNEIVVVASGCTDKTVEIASRYQRLHHNIKIILEKVRNGKTSALNLALNAVTSDLIVFLPADVRPGKGSIAKLIGGFRPEIGIRVGRPVPVDEEASLMGRLSHLIWTLHNRTMKELSSEGRLGHATGEFFAIRRGIINQLPPDVVNDDAFIAIAVQRAGLKIDYEGGAFAFMRGPGTVVDYVSQRRRVHFGHIQVMKSTGRYPTVFETQALIRPALFLQILRAEMKGLKGGLRALVMGGTLEMISLTLSAVDRLLGRTHVLWRMVESTKSLPGSMPVPFATLSSVGVDSFSTRDAYLQQSLDRSWRSDLAHGQLSPRLEVAVLLPYRCY